MPPLPPIMRLPKMAGSRTLASLPSPRSVQQALSRRTTVPSFSRPRTRKSIPGARYLHKSAIFGSPAPKTTDRGPTSKEDTQTDFSAMNVLGNMPPPTTAIDMCMNDGFALNSGLKVTGAGVLLVAGEVFKWRPWIGANATSDEHKRPASSGGKLQNKKGQWDVDKHAWGILDLVWPKPDLLILGTGRGIIPLSPETRRNINELGIRIEVQDTRNAAAQFNMLATERGLQQVAAALIPIGWREER